MIIRLETMLLNILRINMHIKSLNEKPEVFMQHNICQLWCIQLIIPSTDGSDVVTGVLGQAITLSCPRLNNDTVISGVRILVKAWFRGPASNPTSTVARLVTKGDFVQNNFKADADERMWIDSKDGDLIIQNLTLWDSGYYTCSFTGSEAQTIQLNVITGMFYWPVKQ